MSAEASEPAPGDEGAAGRTPEAGPSGGAPTTRPKPRAGALTTDKAGTHARARGDADEGMEDDGEDTASTASGLQQEQDPFYDEAADDADAAWAERQRGGRVSDAVLSCPGCFTTLCMDCQRHEKYHQQYRAMFVMNCQVEDEGDEAGGGGGGGAGGGFDPAASGAGGGGSAGPGRGGRRPKRAKTSAQYRRVCCGVCGTEVGAYEAEEELYHFYHVFPSNA